MRTGQFNGWFETKGVTPEGATMVINADCLHGSLQVEIIDPATSKVLGKSVVIKGENKTRIPIAWESGARLAKGSQVVFRFRMERSDLYSFWFE
jgi:hypothetical protein